jgi:hypothetical protein
MTHTNPTISIPHEADLRDDPEHAVAGTPSLLVTPNQNGATELIRGFFGLFIKGPIPLAWLQKANALGGSTGTVAAGLWFYAGLNKSRRFRIDRRLDQLCCVTRQTRNMVLGRLQSHRLINIYPKKGAYPTIEVLDVKQ